MSKLLKNRIGIIRGLDTRFTNAEFAARFKKFEPIFIGNLNREIEGYLKREKVKYINLPLKNRFFFDPVKLLLGKSTHQSWLTFEARAFENALRMVDIVEIYEPYFFDSAQVASLAHKINIPVVTEIWTSFSNHPANFIPPYSFNVKNVIKKTDLFILRCKKALSYLEPFNIPNSKKVVIYHGVDLKKFYPVKTRKKDEKTRILFVGQLVKHKGLDDILAIFEILSGKYKKKLELLICGQGFLKNQVLKMSKYLPIKFFGQVSHQDIPAIYRQADIFCGPSKEYFSFGIKRGEEFVGYTFMEAMASGLPIVTSDSGGIPEIVGEDNLIIHAGDRDGLNEALEKLIENEVKRTEIGNKNRKRAERLFDLKKQVNLTEETIFNKFFYKS